MSAVDLLGPRIRPPPGVFYCARLLGPCCTAYLSKSKTSVTITSKRLRHVSLAVIAVFAVTGCARKLRTGNRKIDKSLNMMFVDGHADRESARQASRATRFS